MGQQSQPISNVAAVQVPEGKPGDEHIWSRVVQPWRPRLGLRVMHSSAPWAVTGSSPSWVIRRMALPGGPRGGLSKTGPTRVGTPLRVAVTEAPGTRQLLDTLNCVGVNVGRMNAVE
ncbi:hypothetical protein Vretimale_8585 [Volvox reticuliferus]|uniref:Uncharacterized protein n=1 Tax=Volvox reticuliferus TaxID=1737510 RepID=A0A8J4GBR4_9CHLO|nr:hypothetical protein Vretimale_8585 [Volvox reticuliferus]